MVGRMLAAATRRVAESDEDEFAQLIELERHLVRLLDDAVLGLRQSGMTWEQIGAAAGVTRQGAHQRWRHVELGDGARADG
jgi:hypothetical protein